MAATTDNQKLKDWVDHWVGILQPDEVEWCDGSDEEWDRLTQLLIDGGTFERLADDKRPSPTPATSPGSRTARSSAPSASTTPAPPTTGGRRPR